MQIVLLKQTSLLLFSYDICLTWLVFKYDFESLLQKKWCLSNSVIIWLAVIRDDRSKVSTLTWITIRFGIEYFVEHFL